MAGRRTTGTPRLSSTRAIKKETDTGAVFKIITSFTDIGAATYVIAFERAYSRVLDTKSGRLRNLIASKDALHAPASKVLRIPTSLSTMNQGNMETGSTG